ncbi:hypothetical protein AWC38_SpisGene8770 [Stylophora pistillata]|uniref:Uncharacterized protein n=1 Tax=Stylophora pistillata TaxID=50429 RepID=A0A2B4SBZ5_STYPI|nr:hypothetical protein AWC38_SpisGene8770 [Stylophora pistillata]
MEWTEEHDNCMCQEILVLESFKYKKGSISRGQIWEEIANNLKNGLKLLRFKVSKHAVGERYTLLSEKIKAKMRDEEKASGIECDLSEMEKALEEIAEKEAAGEDTVENDKKKVDNAKAMEMRNRALESLGRKGSGTKRRRIVEAEQFPSTSMFVNDYQSSPFNNSAIPKQKQTTAKDLG